MTATKLTLGAAILAIAFASSASAMPVTKLGGVDAGTPQVDQVRLVCNRWGRCWHVPGWRYHYGWHRGWHRGWHHRW